MPSSLRSQRRSVPIRPPVPPVPLVLVAWLAAEAASAAQPGPAIVEELVVYGRAQQQVGVSQAASEGLVGYDDIRLPPLLRTGELVEAVPGMVATQHSGTGKANQYFLRGFNLDHGTDFSAKLDHVPVNMRTHGHGQGYLDLNFMIPELVETTTYRKGPYSARVGDFASAGSVDFAYYGHLPESRAQVTLGQDAYRRGLLAGGAELGRGDLTTVLDVTTYDGPWDLPEDLRQIKGFVRYGKDLAGGRVTLSLHGYDGDWDATDQIPRRAVASGLIDELGYIDPDLGGSTDRYAVTAEFAADTWAAGMYVVDYSFALYSNFTYRLEDPVNGDEFEQRDDRRMWGLWADGSVERALGSRPLTIRWGGEARYDDINTVALYGTIARSRLNSVREDRVKELSAGVYGEAEVAWTDRWRMTVGLRGDAFDWSVDAQRPANSGDGHDTLVSPKLSMAYRLAAGVEGYVSWGSGFHSNDVRGSTIAVDPVSGDPVDAVDVLVGSEGAELGLRWEQGRSFNATLAAFWLALDSELLYVGDAGTTEPQGATRRTGVEATAFWQATEWLALNAAYTYTDARFDDDAGGGDDIPGAVEETAVIGATAAWTNGLSASARVRYLGEAPLVEDGSVHSEGSVLLSAGAGYRRGPLEFRLDVFNLLDSDDDDITYYYASRLTGEPADGVEDVHFHPMEPRTIRGTFTYHWGG